MTWRDRRRQLAQEHVTWLLDIMEPLLLAEFEHGFEHGREDLAKEADIKEGWEK